MNRTEYRLREWGRFVREHAEHAEEMGENILHRCSEFGYTDPTTGQMKHDEDGSPLGRDSVLCPDMPLHIMRVEQKVRRLDDLQRWSVTLWYCAPIKEDSGQPYTKAELAKLIGINKGKFRAELRKGVRRIEGMRISA